jgi:hypothetical protein
VFKNFDSETRRFQNGNGSRRFSATQKVVLVELEKNPGFQNKSTVASRAHSFFFSISPLKNAQTRRNKFFYFKLRNICQISLEISRIKIIPYMVMLRIMWAIGTYDYMLKIQKSVLSATQYPQACQWSAVKSIS